MSNRTKFLTLPLAAALLMGGSLAVHAQQAAAADDYATTQAAASDFSDAELRSFAGARQQVDAIRTEVMGKLQTTQDPEEAQKVQEEANAKMIAAVESNGLTREKYNEIAQAAISDPALASKIASLQ